MDNGITASLHVNADLTLSVCFNSVRFKLSDPTGPGCLNLFLPFQILL